MMPTKNVGAPSPVNRQVLREGSAKNNSLSADMSLSRIILRMLEVRDLRAAGGAA